ncbi:unnamed protein product [Clonostachys rhizophaga]|uniref:Uncharacterized protein n=1 Tax=Clonostachys rhizophaga TaxID=160324 RepID=A0A9N9VRV0_9HYPO|nr:unnamed protein product [Clonostachys rhizophaga]
MFSAKQLSLAGLIWLGLTNKGLALSFDTSDDLMLVSRSPLDVQDLAEFSTRDIYEELVARGSGRPPSGPKGGGSKGHGEYKNY